MEGLFSAIELDNKVALPLGFTCSLWVYLWSLMVWLGIVNGSIDDGNDGGGWVV